MSHAGEVIRFVKASRGPVRIQRSFHPDAPDGDLAITSFGSSQEQLACVNGMGQRLWTRPFQGVLGPPSFDHERIYVGCSDGFVVGLGQTDGEVLWTWRHDTPMAATCVDEDVLVVCDAAGGLAELEAETGVLQRQLRIGRSLAIPQIGMGSIWLSVVDGELFRLAAGTRALMWRSRFEAGLASTAFGSGEHIVVPLLNGVVHAVWRATGRWLVRIEGGDPDVRPTIGDGRLWVADVAQGLLAYEPGGTATAYGRLSGATSIAISEAHDPLRLFYDGDLGLWGGEAHDPICRKRVPVNGVPAARIRCERELVLSLRVDSGRTWLHAIDVATCLPRWSTALD